MNTESPNMIEENLEFNYTINTEKYQIAPRWMLSPMISQLRRGSLDIMPHYARLMNAHQLSRISSSKSASTISINPCKNFLHSN